MILPEEGGKVGRRPMPQRLAILRAAFFVYRIIQLFSKLFGIITLRLVKKRGHMDNSVILLFSNIQINMFDC